jgi:hypothetical protein
MDISTRVLPSQISSHHKQVEDTDAYTPIKADYTFVWVDTFNLMFGIIEGAMGAIPSNTNNYYCSLNLTAGRLNINYMIDYFS